MKPTVAVCDVGPGGDMARVERTAHRVGVRVGEFVRRPIREKRDKSELHGDRPA